MKKIIIILTVLSVISILTNAQIPNNGFENWVSFGNYENPNGWATMNPYCSGPFYSCTKSTDHFPPNVGNYSIRLENNTSLTQMTGGFGMAITDTMAYPFQPAFPIIGNPTSLCGYYKYNSLNNDSMFIRIVFFENSVMLGYNTFVTGITTSTWTSFILPLTYPTADSATLYFSAFYPTSQSAVPKGNSVLQIDNLSFDSLINSNSELNVNKSGFNIFPNPAFYFLNINIENENNNEITLTIYNLTGKIVKSEILKNNQQQINIGDLSNGIYLVEIKSKDLTEKQKLIIQK